MTALVSPADYARITKDTATNASDVADALTDTLGLVDDYCNRHFAYGTWTETLYVYRDGKVYPTNTPLDVVTTPAGLAPTAIQGAGVYLGVFLPTPAYINAGDWNAAVPPQSTVTYKGGYQPFGTTDGPTPQLPVKVMRVVCRIAWMSLHPVALQGVPAGAKSASVGDVSVSTSGSLSPFVVVDPSIEADLKPYRKGRQAHAWQR